MDPFWALQNPKLAHSAWQDGSLWREHEKNSAKNDKEVLCAWRRHPKVNRSLKKSLPLRVDKYLQHLAVKGYSESTLRVRRVCMEMFLSWFRQNRITAPTQVTRASLESDQRYLFICSPTERKTSILCLLPVNTRGGRRFVDSSAE